MEFVFPKTPGSLDDPVWTGSGFRIGLEHVPVLRYTRCNAGWDAHLTDFLEQEVYAGKYFLDKASRRHALSEIARIPENLRGVILETGTSSGYFLREIQEKFPETFLIGSDCIPGILEKTAIKNPGIPLIQFDLSRCPLPDNCVDCVISLNVLEHIRDDREGLKQIYRILRPGGRAIIEVPANPHLFDIFDEQFMHFRRYDLREFSDRARHMNFSVIESTHFGFFLYPVFRIIKLRNKMRMAGTPDKEKLAMKNLIRMGGIVGNDVLYQVMKCELALGKIFRYPFGIRCLLTLQKPAGMTPC